MSTARYVEEGAHIEEWNPLCQYQSDKAVDDVRCLSFYVCWDDLLTRLDYREIRRDCQKASLPGRRYRSNRQGRRVLLTLIKDHLLTETHFH